MLQIFSPAATARIAQQFVPTATLQQEAIGPQGDRFGNARRVVERREQQHRQVRLVELDAAQGRQAVAVGQADVEQHHIDFFCQGQFDGCLAGPGFRHDLDFRACQEGFHADADHFLVVGNEKLDFGFRGHTKGLCSGKVPKEPGANTYLLCTAGVGIASTPDRVGEDCQESPTRIDLSALDRHRAMIPAPLAWAGMRARLRC